MWIDASSGYEVGRAIEAGFEPEKISLSTQELPANFASLIDRGVTINACSMEQLRRIGGARTSPRPARLACNWEWGTQAARWIRAPRVRRAVVWWRGG
jgi:diaminopimelate decarboxylase